MQARLSKKDGRDILCWHCSTIIAKRGPKLQSGYEYHALPGFGPAPTDGVWRLTHQAQESIRRGRRPALRRYESLKDRGPTSPMPPEAQVRGEFHILDGDVLAPGTRVQCPNCTAVSELSTELLQV
jgi:hypothetical protein